MTNHISMKYHSQVNPHEITVISIETYKNMVLFDCGQPQMRLLFGIDLVPRHDTYNKVETLSDSEFYLSSNHNLPFLFCLVVGPYVLSS